MGHLVITIGCEYGAKGNAIGRKIAEDLGIKFYDRELVDQIIEEVGIPKDIITPLIFILIRASVHYALFEDEFYLQAQLRVLKQGISMYLSRKDSLLTEEKPL